MEDSNEISGDEVNRITNLERIVRRFRIASSGDGKVFGSFGKFFKPPDELSLSERLGNLESAANLFNVTGDNVDVAGTFDDGFRLS